MFTTPNEVTRITGVAMPDTTFVIQAQAIIETYIGRTEGQIEDPRDKRMLAYATAYQAAYMTENADTIFQQIRVTAMGEGNFLTSFDRRTDAPFIAPLAEIACRNLSWKKSTTVRTAPIRTRKRAVKWEAD